MFFLTLLFASLLSVSVMGKNTVVTLDLEKYSGRWYQVYGNKYDQLFEKYASCITADYGLNADSTVSVLNSQYEQKNGIQQIEGYAYYGSDNNNPITYPGELMVHLNGVNHDAPYWVYNLGPEVNEYYDWAIVSDQLKLSLFVLARNVESFYENYNDEVLSILNSNNFISKSSDLVQVSHKNCSYVPEPLGSIYKTNIQTQCQVASYLRKSGFPESSIGTMVCTSKYESSYNCDAKNTNTDKSSDYGLFQINSYWWCSGDPMSKYNGCNIACTSLYNCQSNSNCAYTVWKQQGYNAWYGYKNHKTECDNYKVSC